MLKINKIEISGQHVAFSVFVKCANSDQTHANQRYFADETCTYLLKRYWIDEFMWGITLITINKHTKSIEFSFTFLLPVWRRCSNNALWVMSLPRLYIGMKTVIRIILENAVMRSLHSRVTVDTNLHIFRHFTPTHLLAHL